MTEHIVGTEHQGADVRAVCSCGWKSYWTVDAPDSVRDHQERHLTHPDEGILRVSVVETIIAEYSYELVLDQGDDVQGAVEDEQWPNLADWSIVRHFTDVEVA